MHIVLIIHTYKSTFYVCINYIVYILDTYTHIYVYVKPEFFTVFY